MTLPVIKLLQYVRFDGKSKPLADGISFPQLVFAFMTTFVVSLLLPPSQVFLCFIVCIITTSYVAFRSKTRIGGYTGDVLGATQQLNEISIYTTLTSKII